MTGGGGVGQLNSTIDQKERTKLLQCSKEIVKVQHLLDLLWNQESR